jgi:hypothetical protein
MIDPYSIIDLTRAIYAVLLHSLGQCCRFLLRNPSVELAFLQVLFICSFHLRSSAIYSPRQEFDGTCSRIWLFNV